MNYRSIADLSRDTTKLARSLPADVDLVVGIPRSGLLAANMLCLQLNTPMTDVQGLRDRRLLASGYRYEGRIDDFAAVDRVLVVDDSVNSGRQMRETRAELEECDLPFDVEFAAVYVSPTGHRYVDHWVEVVHTPRFFEWNLMHHPILKQSCMVIDGVLCREPTPEENDGGARYREFVRTVEPDVIPTERVSRLVTSRSERYREETEAWLERHDVHYDELVMMDGADAVRPRTAKETAAFKAEVYRTSRASLFVESDPAQAAEIARLSGRPAFSHGTNELLEPGAVAEAYEKSSEYLTKFRRNPVTFSVTAGRYATDVVSGAIERRFQRR